MGNVSIFPGTIVDEGTNNRTYHNCSRCQMRISGQGTVINSICFQCQQPSKYRRRPQKLKQQQKMKSEKLNKSHYSESREETKENNVFCRFKSLNMENAMKYICNEINEHVSMSDAITSFIDNIETNLKGILNADITLFVDCFDQYRKYADDIKIGFRECYDEEYENEENEGYEEGKWENHFNDFPKQLQNLINRIKTAKQAFDDIQHDYNVFIKACEDAQDAETSSHDQSIEIPHAILKIAHNLKTLHNKEIMGQTKEAIGGLIGSFITKKRQGLIFRDHLPDYMRDDRSSTKNALQIIGDNIEGMLNKREREYLIKTEIEENNKTMIDERVKGLDKLEKEITNILCDYKKIEENMQNSEKKELEALKKEVDELQNVFIVLSEKEGFANYKQI